jgi:hypothetical protein
MTVLHSGSTKKFAVGWEGIFARRSSKGAGSVQAKAAAPSKKQTSARKQKAAKAAKRHPR